MRYFVYALYSPSYSMVKIGKTRNFFNRWKQLAHWHFDSDKSFALCCSSEFAQRRIEDTLKIFFDLHPSIEAISTHQDGYTECFDACIIEDVRDFFKYFSKRYFNDYVYIENIIPFLHVPNTYLPKNKVDSFVKNNHQKSCFPIHVVSKNEAIDLKKIDIADF